MSSSFEGVASDFAIEVRYEFAMYRAFNRCHAPRKPQYRTVFEFFAINASWITNLKGFQMMKLFFSFINDCTIKITILQRMTVTYFFQIRIKQIQFFPPLAPFLLEYFATHRFFSESNLLPNRNLCPPMTRCLNMQSGCFVEPSLCFPQPPSVI